MNTTPTTQTVPEKIQEPNHGARPICGRKEYTVCVAGWYFLNDLYETLTKMKDKVAVVAHKDSHHMKNFDKVAVIENIGLEFHIYNHFLNKIWNGMDDIIFLQDDAVIGDCDIFNKISDQCVASGYDVAYVWESDKQKRKNGNAHGRCVYVSAGLASTIVMNGGIWCNIEDRGYTNKREFKKWYAHRNLGIQSFNRLICKLAKSVGHVFISRKDFKLLREGR